LDKNTENLSSYYVNYLVDILVIYDRISAIGANEMTEQMKYRIEKADGTWETVPTFSASGIYKNEADAQAECDRRNAKTAKPVPAQPRTHELTDEQIDKLNKSSIEHGSGLVLPTLRNADKIARRAELYNEEPPED